MKRRSFLTLAGASVVLSACTTLTGNSKSDASAKPRIGLALGGGASRGFAHIGVIKALETHGIVPDIVVGTSAGSVVGALYAAGLSAFDLQTLASKMDENAFKDWALTDRSFLKGEGIETFVNREVKNQPIEALKHRFAAVATDLSNGEVKVFTTGNTGAAVRASSAVPGVFSPVTILGKEYVDGGLSSPVPVNVARQLGATLVIAVDISARPSGKKGGSTVDVLLDTVAIMGNTIGTYELKTADVVIRPNVQGFSAANFQQRHEAILEGERAGFAAIPRIREKMALTA